MFKVFTTSIAASSLSRDLRIAEAFDLEIAARLHEGMHQIGH